MHLTRPIFILAPKHSVAYVCIFRIAKKIRLPHPIVSESVRDQQPVAPLGIDGQ